MTARASHSQCSRSQEARLLEYLCTGKPVTPIMALRRWGIFRLGARIYNLRKYHDIRSRLVKRGHARVAEYRLRP